MSNEEYKKKYSTPIIVKSIIEDNIIKIGDDFVNGIIYYYGIGWNLDQAIMRTRICLDSDNWYNNPYVTKEDKEELNLRIEMYKEIYKESPFKISPHMQQIYDKMDNIEYQDTPVYCNECGLPKYNCCCKEDSE